MKAERIAENSGNVINFQEESKNARHRMIFSEKTG